MEDTRAKLKEAKLESTFFTKYQEEKPKRYCGTDLKRSQDGIKEAEDSRDNNS